jgi:hypothetical protein
LLSSCFSIRCDSSSWLFHEELSHSVSQFGWNVHEFLTNSVHIFGQQITHHHRFLRKG